MELLQYEKAKRYDTEKFEHTTDVFRKNRMNYSNMSLILCFPLVLIVKTLEHLQ